MSPYVFPLYYNIPLNLKRENDMTHRTLYIIFNDKVMIYNDVYLSSNDRYIKLYGVY